MGKKFNPIICVDFDGVIHSYTSGWQGVDVVADPPVDGAIEWLIDMLPDCVNGDYWIADGLPIAQIYSSRSKDPAGIKAMKAWLLKWGLPRHYIDNDQLKFPTEKPAAFLTLDDRAICFNGEFPSVKDITNFKPW